MITKVTKESLSEHIAILEERKAEDLLSINGFYQPEAYKMLLALLEKEDDKR